MNLWQTSGCFTRRRVISREENPYNGPAHQKLLVSREPSDSACLLIPVSTNPFMYAIVPVLPAAGGTGSTSLPTLQIHLTPTLAPRESLSLPGPAVGALTVSSLTGLSLPDATRSAATSSTARVLLVSTPTDKTLSASEGSTVWAVQAGDVGEQIDELVRDGRLVDAIGLAESVGDTSLSPVSQLRSTQVHR